MAKIDMAKFAKFCSDTGFIFQSSSIYGGINGFWDYGPLGVELKKNIKDAWWQDMVRNPPPGPDGQEIKMVGLDCSIIMNPKVWIASGHVGGFSDPMVDDKETKQRFRADHLQGIYSQSSPKSVKKAWKSDPAGIVHGTQIVGEELLLPVPDRTVIASSPDEAVRQLEEDKSLRKSLEIKSVKRIGLVTGFVVGIQIEIDFGKGPEKALVQQEKIALELASEHIPSPYTGKIGHLTTPRAFNLMFESFAGPIQSEENKVYLRPETAQGIFANYRNVLNSSRLKLPFGIAQVGKAFRNEINPRNFTFRTREFEQMEIEFFCHPDESMKWYEYWRDLRKKWYSTLGIQSNNLKPREQGKEELAHYSIGTTDIEYMFPFSDEPQELEGVAHRGSFDLTAHAKMSGKDDELSYFDEELWNNDSQTMATRSFKEWLKSNPTAEQIAKYKFVPHVIEPSAGADRFTLAVLCEAYHEDTVKDAKGNDDTRTVLKFHPRLAPIKAAIFPLVNKDGMPEVAMKLYRELKASYNVAFDDKGAVGRRYRRQDEIGTPYCITIDGDTLKDETVTIRDRDTLQQRRVKLSEVKGEIDAMLKG